MKLGDLFLATVIAAIVGIIIAKCAESHPKPQHVNTSERFRHINGLPQTCTGTIGGDTMICPCDGFCPSNGQKCEPSKWYGQLHDRFGHVTENGYIACPCSTYFPDGERCQASSYTPP